MRFIWVTLFLFWTSSACAHEQEQRGYRADEGDFCGGFGGIKCKKGLVCEYADDTIVDGLGVCVPE